MEKHNIVIGILLLLIIVMLFSNNTPKTLEQPPATNLIVVDNPPIIADPYLDNNLGPFIHQYPYRFPQKQPNIVYRTQYNQAINKQPKKNRKELIKKDQQINNNNNNNNNNNDNNPPGKKKPVNINIEEFSPTNIPTPKTTWQQDLAESQFSISKLTN